MTRPSRLQSARHGWRPPTCSAKRMPCGQSTRTSVARTSAVGSKPKVTTRTPAWHGHRHDLRVVAIEHGRAAGAEPAHHSALLLPGPVERAEAAMVLGPDRGDDRDVRPEHRGIGGHLAGSVDRDLECGVALPGCQSQQLGGRGSHRCSRCDAAPAGRARRRRQPWSWSCRTSRRRRRASGGAPPSRDRRWPGAAAAATGNSWRPIHKCCRPSGVERSRSFRRRPIRAPLPTSLIPDASPRPSAMPKPPRQSMAALPAAAGHFALSA